MIKILDFGIAKGPDTPLIDQTAPETMLGTPSYVSPEQAAGDGSIDHGSDLWSMAVVLYQTVTGVLPFQGPTMGCVLRKVFMEPPPRMADVAPDLPPELDAFFDKALAKGRSERFASIEEMTHAFAEIAAPSLKARLSSMLIPYHPTARAAHSTPPCSEPDLAPTVRESGVVHVGNVVPGATPLPKPDSPVTKSSLGWSSRRRRSRPWLFAAATPAAACALIFPVTLDNRPDVGPAVVLTAELPPSLPPTFVPPPPAAPISPGKEPSAAAPRETKPTSASTAGRGAPQRHPAGTQTAALAPSSVNNTSPKTDPRPDAPRPSPAACQEKPTPSSAAPTDGVERRWF
jgi:eukaryotic-like serine/threonine-protein kinase